MINLFDDEVIETDEVAVDVINEDDVEDEVSQLDKSEDDLDPKKLENIVFSGADWTIETIVNQIRKKNIILSPKFQRRNVWNSADKTNFIESILLNIPIPNILLGEDINNKGKFLVIDGKQRLITLAEFYGVTLGDEVPSRRPFRRLGNPEILSNLKGFTYQDLEKKGMKEKDQLDNYTIRTNMMRNIPNMKYLYEVFTRINTGSEKLSPQELRQSIYPGPFMDYISEHSDTPEINHILNLKGMLHTRMKDSELLLRCYAFKYFIDKYDNSISGFLDYTVDSLNKKFSTLRNEIEKYYFEIIDTIKFVRDNFDKDAFTLMSIGRERTSFNRPVFDLMMYFFGNIQNRNLVKESSISLKSTFNELMRDELFVFALTTNTHQTLHTRVRFKILYDLLKSTYGILNDSIISKVSEIEFERLRNQLVETL